MGHINGVEHEGAEGALVAEQSEAALDEATVAAAAAAVGRAVSGEKELTGAGLARALLAAPQLDEDAFDGLAALLEQVPAKLGAALAHGPADVLVGRIELLVPPHPETAALWTAVAAALPPDAPAELRFDLGLILRADVGDAALGLPLLQQAADARPDDADCFLELGNAFTDLGQPGPAAAAFARAAELAPADAAPWFNLGLMLEGQDDVAAAADAFTRAVALDPGPLHHHALGRARASLNDPRATASLEAAVAGYDADDPDALLWRSAARCALGQLDAALADLAAAVAADPSLADQAEDEPDLAPLRALPGWSAAVGG